VSIIDVIVRQLSSRRNALRSPRQFGSPSCAQRSFQRLFEACCVSDWHAE